MNDALLKRAFLVAASHDGNLINGPGPVAAMLAERGHRVVVYLQKRHTAAASYASGGTVANLLARVEKVRVVDELPTKCAGALSGFHAVISAMSPVNESLEVEAARFSAGHGNFSAVPRLLFTVEDGIGGRNNGSWPEHRRYIKTLYAPVADNQHFGCTEKVVGPVALNRWRGVDVSVIAQTARQKLGMGDEPVLYFSPSPEVEGADGLTRLAELIREVVGCGIPANTVFLLNRHRRELTKSIEGNAGKYAWAQRVLMQAGIRVVDNSPEYGHLVPSTDGYAILPECRPGNFLTYSEMLAVTHGNGVALSFFGTDVLMVAPHLPKMAPVLWLDPRVGGRVLAREKGFGLFEGLPVVKQFVRDDQLMSWLCSALTHPSVMGQYHTALSKAFTFPTSDPVQVIVDDILAELDKLDNPVEKK